MPKFDNKQKPAPEDWHPAYLIYRLRLKGQSLRRLSRLHNYDVSAASLALRLAWPKMERLIAEAVGVAPQEIWPSRYDDNGTPKSGLHKAKVNTRRKPVNVDRRRAA